MHPARSVMFGVLRFASVLIGAGLLLRTASAEYVVSAPLKSTGQPEVREPARLAMPAGPTGTLRPGRAFAERSGLLPPLGKSRPRHGRRGHAHSGDKPSLASVVPLFGLAPGLMGQGAVPAEPERHVIVDRHVVAAKRALAEKQALAEKNGLADKLGLAGAVAFADKPGVAETVAVADRPALVDAVAPAAKPAVDDKSGLAASVVAVQKPVLAEKSGLVETVAAAQNPSRAGKLALGEPAPVVPKALPAQNPARAAKRVPTEAVAVAAKPVHAQPATGLLVPVHIASGLPAVRRSVVRQAPAAQPAPAQLAAVQPTAPQTAPAPAQPVQISLAPPVMRPGPRTTVLTSDLQTEMRRPASAWSYAEGLPPELTGRSVATQRRLGAATAPVVGAANPVLADGSGAAANSNDIRARMPKPAF